VPPVTAFIALGSNLGDRTDHIVRAVALLGRDPGITLTAASDAREYEALTLPGANPQPPYLNAVVKVETTLSARQLLSTLLAIEQFLGRDRSAGERWAPRTIDLDLLLYGGEIIDEPGCTVPHPRLHERRFVLEPLAQIAPKLRHPRLRKTAQRLLADLDAREIIAFARRIADASRRCVALLGALWLAPALVAAAPPPLAALQPAPIPVRRDPAEVLALFRAAYRTGPIAERIDIAATADGVTRRESINLYVDPLTRTLLLGLGPLSVHASDERVLAWHEATPDRYARILAPPFSLEPPSPLVTLREAIPALPIPQLAAAFSADDSLPDLFPFCSDFGFTAAVQRGDIIQMSARSGDCESVLTLDAATGRLRAATLRVLATGLSIELTAEQAQPLDAAALNPAASLESRTALPSIELLDPSIGDLAPGDPAPRMPLFDVECSPWRVDLEEGPIAVILFRSIIPQVRIARAAVAQRVPLRGVVVVEGLRDVALFERIGQNAQLWGDGILWTLSPRSTLLRYAPTAPAVFVLFDADHAIRAVVPLTEEMDEKAIATAVRDAIANLQPK
jgi:2-amino-4-hydroxy-6-hydroxymethyldihydropteridine diphosphokinase